MTYDCSGPRFGELVNPYSGERILVKMSVSRTGRVRYFAPDTYSPAQFFPTAKEAFRHWNRVNGVEGMKDRKPIVCAYSGRPLTLEHTAEGYHYVGGVDLHMLYDRGEFLYFAAMRDGKSPYPAPAGEDVRVEKPAERAEITKTMRRHADEMSTDLTQDAIDMAEKTMSEIDAKVGGLEKSSTVSMAVSVKKKGRK